MIFRRRSAPDAGWFAVAPEAAASTGTAGWQGAALRSPVAEPGHQVVRSRDGLLEVLRGRELSRPSDRYRQVDARRRQIVLSPQSIPTLEGVDVQVTAVVVVRVASPIAFLDGAADPDAEVYLAVQISLRDLVAQLPLEEVLVRRMDLAPVRAAADVAGRQVGLVIEDLVLKDVSASRLISSAREQELLVEITARTEMERARAEVKATRARLASAQMLERSPVLAQLRLLEALPAGTTLKIDGRGLAPQAGGLDASADEADGGL